MQAVDQEVLFQLLHWLEGGRSAWLCTIVQTYGSSPRPVGSLLACNHDGEVVGSLSGGCVEDDLLDKLKRNALPSQSIQMLRYGLNPTDTERLGLPCGGQLSVIAEPWRPTAESVAQLRHICARLEARQCVRRTVEIPQGASRVDDADRFEALRLHELDASDNRMRLEHTYGPRAQLFLIGAGMVSFYLAQMAQALDFFVTVVDPREHLIEAWKVAGTRTLVAMPDDAVLAHANDPQTAIVTLTHDPRIDDMALMEALNTQAFYIGSMGSEKTSANRRLRLKQLDLSDNAIARLRAPVGLPIGSKTPPEIAIAILAEITAVQKQREAAANERARIALQTA